MSLSRHRDRVHPTNGWQFNTGLADDSRSGVQIDDSAIARRLGRTIVPAVADLIELAAALHVVDRMTRRPPAQKGGDSWARDLSLTIGVRDPERWNDDNIARGLRIFLTWLTDDTWDIRFINRVSSYRTSESTQFLFPNPVDGSEIALYSGGLDSFAGLALDLAKGTEPILVSVISNGRQGHSQTQTVDSLQDHFGTKLRRVPIDFHLQGTRAKESSHRIRGFGFLALAAVVAASADVNIVRVYENGIGAINLPYSRAQVGAQTTRSMHPKSLSLAATLFSDVLQHPLSVENMNAYWTKAEMCLRLPVELHPVVPLAMSCDTAFSYRASDIANCGICTSCLLRRQALWGASLGKIDRRTQYRTDVLSAGSSDPEKLYNLKAMLSQAARMSLALDDSEPWNSLLGEFPELLDVVEAHADKSPETDVSIQLMDMFRRYVNEWLSFPVQMAGAYLPNQRQTALGPDKESNARRTGARR